MRTLTTIAPVLALLLAGAPGSGLAALSDQEKCQLKKLKEAEKYAKCRLKEEGKAIRKSRDASVLPNLTKCDMKFSEKWSKWDTKWGAACTTSADEASMKATITDQANSVVGSLFPNTVAFACDALAQTDCLIGEACYVDRSDPPASSCQNEAFPNLTQGDVCNFVNGCAKGYGCLLVDLQSPDFLCAFHCNAVTGSPACADGPGPNFTCVALNRFYGDVSHAPADFGICVDPNVYTIP